MRIVDCEQGTPEWFEARLGVPTASCFGKILTATGKPSKQAAGYMEELLAEWLAGGPLESFSSMWTERGKETEAEARDYYEFTSGDDVEQVGFVLRDDGLAGASPDGLIGDEGGLEIKCCSPHVHVAHLLRDGIPTEYIPQVQGGMWVCNRQWWSFVAYHPTLPSVIVRVERDDEYIEALAEAVYLFAIKMDQKKKLLIEKGYEPCRKN